MYCIYNFPAVVCVTKIFEAEKRILIHLHNTFSSFSIRPYFSISLLLSWKKSTAKWEKTHFFTHSLLLLHMSTVHTNSEIEWESAQFHKLLKARKNLYFQRFSHPSFCHCSYYFAYHIATQLNVLQYIWLLGHIRMTEWIVKKELTPFSPSNFIFIRVDLSTSIQNICVCSHWYD